MKKTEDLTEILGKNFHFQGLVKCFQSMQIILGMAQPFTPLSGFFSTEVHR